jgi:hypothetical protein
MKEFERIIEMNVCDKRNHEIHQIHKSGVLKSLFSWFIMICAVFSSYAGVVEATSPVFGLSLKSDGVRQSAGAETLTYSSQWDGGDGATVTIAENGAVVADGLSGEGTCPWSVQKTGEYTLTHTTYTNGIAGKVETATFVVPGPELTFEYDGGLFVGGKVTINGNLEGWTIYYTLDGSTPTTESLKYTGPFTLSSAANLKAYAVSDSGMSTPLIENNYAVVERARIENVRARQRWPWNGKVDIDFDVVGSAGVSYGVVLSVTDTIGGTNLTMRTVTTSDEAAINPTGAKVIPGQYRWTWDAAADHPDGFECDAISVNVDVLGEGAFAYFVRFNANGGEGIMNDEMFIYGVEKVLPANAFKRGGYAFVGWAISPDGEKVYEDKQQIRNLTATSDVIINLYAVWVDKVQLWEGGPYWATTNIGSEKPEDYGYYFWWGDTVGYKREGDKWVASDGSNSNFSFTESNTPTYNKDNSTLQSEGWITVDNVLALEHDAAHIHWGCDWRMPTKQEFDDLNNKCDWTWTTTNGVKGYVVSGRGDYASNSIFLPCAGYGYGTSLNDSGSDGYYWSSVPYSDSSGRACNLYFLSGYRYSNYYSYRDRGRSVRPLQGFTK